MKKDSSDYDVINTFAIRLHNMRIKKNYGVRELAAMAEISHASLIGYEQGKNEANIRTLKKLSECLGTTCDYLLGCTDDPLPKIKNGEKLDIEHKKI